MNNRTQIILTFSILLLSITSFAQKTNNWCGQVLMEQKHLEEHPEEAIQILKAEKQLQEETEKARFQRADDDLLIIPVVFHIIHQNGVENISDAQVFDQMRILNEDYNLKNADIANVIPEFKDIIGKMNIEFRLAQTDPNGLPTNGIDRIVSDKTTDGGNGAKLNQWARGSYLNIWVVKSWGPDIPENVLAYAYKPAGVSFSPARDGIMSLYKYIGSIGTSSPKYARTISHEVGHYLNLSHTWGNTNAAGEADNCNDDDGIFDTPNCIGTFQCDNTIESCGSLDNTQNHMDYSECTVMFTEGQANVARAALKSNVSSRSNLHTAENLKATGVDKLVSANFKANKLSVCQHESIDFTNQSKFDDSNWKWSIAGSETATYSDENPSSQFKNPGLFNVKLTSSNGIESVTEEKVGYIMVNPLLGNFAPLFDDFSQVNQLNHPNWYAVNDFNDNFGFVADATDGYVGFNSNNGTNCLKLENHGNQTNSKDELLTTTYDLRLFSSVEVSFKIAYARNTLADASRMIFYTSNDCGQTWSPKWSRPSGSLGVSTATSDYYTPSSPGDWTTVKIPKLIEENLTQATQFKIVFENKAGNNLYIDDFSISGTYTDVAQLAYPFNGYANAPNTQKINWKAIGDGVDAYEYQLDTDVNFNTGNLQTGINNYIDITDGEDTEYTPSDLVNGQTYYWRVRLIKGGVEQAWSEVWSFTVATNGLSTHDILANKYQFKLYPNPMTNIGILEFSLTRSQDVEITVSNMLGKTQVIQNKTYFGAGSHIFNISELKFEKGIYILNLNIDGEIIHQKFVVQ